MRLILGLALVALIIGVLFFPRTTGQNIRTFFETVRGEPQVPPIRYWENDGQ